MIVLRVANMGCARELLNRICNATTCDSLAAGLDLSQISGRSSNPSEDTAPIRRDPLELDEVFDSEIISRRLRVVLIHLRIG